MQQYTLKTETDSSLIEQKQLKNDIIDFFKKRNPEQYQAFIIAFGGENNNTGLIIKNYNKFSGTVEISFAENNIISVFGRDIALFLLTKFPLFKKIFIESRNQKDQIVYYIDKDLVFIAKRHKHNGRVVREFDLTEVAVGMAKSSEHAKMERENLGYEGSGIIYNL